MANSLYINIYDYADPNYPFQIFIGGRGTGKTYSAQSGALPAGTVPMSGACSGRPIYMRRTLDAWKMSVDSKQGEGANPYKRINIDNGCNYGYSKINDKLAGLYAREYSDGKLLYTGAPLGYSTSLTALAKLRGLDFSDCSDLIYDEFIKEVHEPKLAGEFEALMNAIETINRNREFTGEAPLRVWMLSNSSDIYNPIFVGLGIVSIAEQMKKKGQQHKYLKDRGLAIHIFDSPEAFYEKKSQTALYKLTKGTKFADEALNNKFAQNDFSLIASRSIKGYIPICSLNEKAYLWKHKSTGEMYVSYTPARCPNYNLDHEQEKRAFYGKIGFRMMDYFISGKITFESYELKAIVLDVIL